MREGRATGTDTFAAVDVGGTHVSVAMVDAQLRVREERRHPLDADAPAAQVLDALADGVRCHAVRAGRVALAIPGPFDYVRGIGDFRGVAKFTTLRGVDVRGELAVRWGLDPEALSFVNDAEAYGLGEWAAGAGLRADRCLALTLGTGVGSAFISHGQCVRDGDDVPVDGNIHVARVDGVPLEDRVSRRALRLAYGRRSGVWADVVDIADSARRGDAVARSVLDDAMRHLARAVAPWVERFGAERIVVGGSMAASGDLLFPPLCAQLAALLPGPVPDVTQGTLRGQEAAMIGAVVGAGHATPSPVAQRA